MIDLLKPQFTLITGDGYYITKYGDSYMLGDYQCKMMVFENIILAKDLLKKIRETKEFEWTCLYILQINKQVIKY